MSKIARSSAVVTVFTVLGLGLSFLSNVVIAASFGAGADMDVFLAATAVPLFITNILSSSLTFTFIPVFAQYRAESPGETWHVVSSFINLSGLVAGAACAAGMLASGHIISLVAPGFDPAKLARSAELLTWLFPVTLFTLLNELMASVYYSNGRFVIPSLNKIIAPLTTVAYVLAFRDSLSTKSIALAMLTAGFLQTAALAAGFFRSGDFDYSFRLDWRHPGVRRVLELMAPLIAGMLIYKAVPVADAFFLSGLPSGSLSHVNYASKAVGALMPIIVSGISVSVFPVMSAYAARGDWRAFSGVIGKSVRMLFFLSLPVVVLAGLYGRPLVQLVFQRGAFLPGDTSAVYLAFAAYILSVPAAAAGSIISQGFYALQRTTLISGIGVAMMLVYIALCALLIGPLGYLAIPAAYALYHNLSSSVTAMVLRSKSGGDWGGVPSVAAKSGAASLAAAALVWPLMRISSPPAAALLCAAAFAAYLAAARSLLKMPEAEQLWNLVSEKLRPGVPR